MVCSARPGRRRAGWLLPPPPTDREPPTDPRPSWSRSAPAGGAVTATPPPARQPPTDPACAPLRRAVLAARPGRLPAPPPHRETACRQPAAHRATRPPRQPPGVLRGRSRGASGATGTRPGGGACGPFRAALIDVQKVLPHRPAVGRPAGSRRVDVSVPGATVALVEHASAAFPPDRWPRLRSCRAAFLPLTRVTSRRLSIAPAAVPARNPLSGPARPSLPSTMALGFAHLEGWGSPAAASR